MVRKHIVLRSVASSGFFYPLIAVASAGLAIYSLYLAYKFKVLDGCVPMRTRAFHIAFWVVGPPLWLWFEWFYLAKPGIEPGTQHAIEKLEISKQSQSVVRALWASSVAILAVGFGFVGL